MPDARDFAKGFGLTRGKSFDDFRITNIQIEHHEVTRNQKYIYPIVVTFRGSGNSSGENLLDILDESLSQHLIINSRYGNPYECWITDIKILSNEVWQSGGISKKGDIITVSMLGHSQRI